MTSSSFHFDSPGDLVWDKKKGDIADSYQLSYGHIIFRAENIVTLKEQIESFFRLSKPLAIYNSLNKNHFRENNSLFFPYDAISTHFLLVKSGNYIFLYSKHTLFIDTTPWIAFSKKYKLYVVVSTRIQTNEFYYYVFLNGELCLSLIKNTSWKTTYLERGLNVLLSVNGENVNNYTFKGFSLRDEEKYVPDYDICLCQINDNIEFYYLGENINLVKRNLLVLDTIYPIVPPPTLAQRLKQWFDRLLGVASGANIHPGADDGQNNECKK